MSLPTELIEMIIIQAIPEGFESMAMTCQKVHAICVPFIEEHTLQKPLHSQFHHFSYYDKTNHQSYPIRGSLDLIERITDNPRIARYIRNADFTIDGVSRGDSYRKSLKDCLGSDPLRRIFADSPHLKEAGLDWQTYYASIGEDLRTVDYSQHAAAFLLTLLPNVENLCLPKKWKLNDATDKLINVVVRQAKQLSYGSRSLACVRQLELPISLTPDKHSELHSVSAFSSLPRIQSLRGYSCVAMDDGGRTTTSFKSPYPYNDFAMNLETVQFAGCNINEIGIAEFLKHSPNLKTLRYSHSITEIAAARDWNIWKFVAAIEREAGNHLEGLSLYYREYRGSIAPGKLSMSGFHRLQNLQLPLDIAIYAEMENNDPFIDELIPASVSQLSFITNGSNHHAMILDVLLRDFANRKKKNLILPALKRICLNCPVRPTNEYKERCASLRTETEKAKLALELMSGLSWPFPSTILPQYLGRYMAQIRASHSDFGINAQRVLRDL